MLNRTLPPIQPLVTASPNPAHPLTRHLAGCWLLNEGAGATVHDVSGSRHDGCLYGGPVWSPGLLGHAVQFDGNDDWISMGDCLDLGTDDVSVLAIVRYTAANQPDSWSSYFFGAIVGKGFLDSTGKGYGLLVNTSNRISWQVRSLDTVVSTASDAALNDGHWHVVVGVCDRDSPTGISLHIDGVRQSATADPTALAGIGLSGAQAFAIGSRQETTGTWYWDFAGSVAAVYVWKRALTDVEIRQLYRDPFSFFTGGRMPAHLLVRTGTVVELSGATGGQSASDGQMRRMRSIAGTTGGMSNLLGTLSVSTPQDASQSARWARMPWLGEALFHGASRAAFQLGTVLTQGRHWVRRNGCTAVYHGPGVEQVDFRDIVHVAEPAVQQVFLPTHLPHPANSTHCYLVRRFNSCGHQEHTTTAATMVRIGPDGELTPPAPNAILGLKGEQTGGGRLRLVWFYCPVDQETAPDQFNVYWDDATGQVDFENPLAAIPYDGRRFYSCRTEALAAGGYVFVVKADSQNHIEGPSSNVLTCQIATAPSKAASLLSLEAI